MLVFVRQASQYVCDNLLVPDRRQSVLVGAEQVGRK